MGYILKHESLGYMIKEQVCTTYSPSDYLNKAENYSNENKNSTSYI